MLDINKLGKEGFVSLKYPNTLRACVEEAMSSWQKFCELSDEEKRTFSDGDRIKDFGYMHRQDTGARADNKELFHASLANMEVLGEKAQAMGDSRATAFIHAVDALIHEIKPLIINFVASIEKTYGIAGLEKRVLSGVKGWTFRYLHYFPEEGEMLANAHADRGDMTLHLYECHDGGEHLDFNNVWKPWPVSQKRAIIFPAMGLQYESAGRLKALWHRIVTTEETRKVGRFAMVAFIDFNQEHSWDSSKHRIQNLDQGFNYLMTFPELEKFFAPNKLQM